MRLYDAEARERRSRLWTAFWWGCVAGWMMAITAMAVVAVTRP